MEVKWYSSKFPKWFWDILNSKLLQMHHNLSKVQKESTFFQPLMHSWKIQEPNLLTVKFHLIFSISVLDKRDYIRIWGHLVIFVHNQVVIFIITPSLTLEQMALNSQMSCITIWHVGLHGKQSSELDFPMVTLSLKALVIFKLSKRPQI